MQSLEEVNLSQNGVIAEGMLELIHAFRSNPKLKILILSGNTLKVDGATAFAQVSKSYTYQKLYYFDFINKWKFRCLTA